MDANLHGCIRLRNRSQSSHAIFAVVYGRFAETRSMASQNMYLRRLRSARRFEHDEHILQVVGDDPGISAREVALACTAWRVLQQPILYPYNLQRVQVLLHSVYSPHEKF